MDKGWRWAALWRLGLLALVVALAVTVPRTGPFLRTQILEVLKDQGFPQARFGDIQIGWQYIEVTDLSLAEKLNLSEGRLDFTWRRLFDHHLDRLTLVGLTLDLVRDSQGFTLSGLPDFAPGGESASWSIGELQLRDTQVSAHLDEGQLQSRWTLNIRESAPGDIEVRAKGSGEASVSGAPPLPFQVSLEGQRKGAALSMKARTELTEGTLNLALQAPWPVDFTTPQAQGQLTLDLQKVNVPGQFTGGGIHGTLGLTLNGDTLSLAPTTPMILTLAALEAVPILAETLTAPLQVQVLPEHGLTLDWVQHRAEGRLVLALPEQTLRHQGRDVIVALPRLDLRGTGNDSEGLTVLNLEISKGQIRLPSENILVENLTAKAGLAPPPFLDSLAATLRSTAQPSLFSPLKVGGAWQGKTFTGQLSGADGKLRLKARGTLGGDRGQADLELLPVTFQPGLLQPVDLSPAHGGQAQNVTGTLSAKGTLAWSPEGITPDLTLSLRDMGLTSGPARLEGMQGDVTLSGFAPLQTPPDQTITATRLTLNGTSLRDLSLMFQVNDDEYLRVEQAVAMIADGYIFIHDLKINPKTIELDGELSVVDVNAQTLLEILEVPDVSLQGRIGGDLPFAWDARGLHVRHGLLANQGPGQLRYQPAVPPAALQGGGEGASLMLDALQDFHYKALRFGLDRDSAGAWMADLHVEGANPNLMDGHPFVFNVNVSGALEAILRRGLAATQLPETVGRAYGTRLPAPTTKESRP
ncbi:hypothetical protein JCM17960_26990 [Magnetospira thiophila]